MNILVLDTETTGLTKSYLPAGDQSQPHLVQLGAILVAVEDGEEPRTLAQLDLLVQPDGWYIPPQAADIHGITTEVATQGGIALKPVLQAFSALLERADKLIAYNIDFDLLVLDAAMCRTFPEAEGLVWPEDQECVMRACTAICKLPSPHGKPGYKWPKLVEAYKYFCDCEPEGQHTALGDCEATMTIWLELQRLDE